MNTSAVLQPVPYGYAAFEEVNTEGFAYVDKTRWIEVLEKSGEKYPLLVRPRRFGKTLFTTMLEAYYDKRQADAFETLFRGTYIGTHRTALANTFYVLSFDFSGLAGEDVYASFQAVVRNGIEAFIARYAIEGVQLEALSDQNPPAVILMNFLNAVWPKTGKKIYVIIDEYDQFTNEILAEDADRFREITSANGFLKNFYARLKSATTRGPIARTFITGVVSIALDSMSSGFNIATNITTDARFAGMLGFTEEELRALIPRVVDLKACEMSLEEVFSRMKMLYNGYRFSADSPVTVFNASMCLYYLKHLAIGRKEPRKLLDPSFSTDLNKVHGILRLGNADTIRSIVERIMQGDPIPIDELAAEVNLNRHEALSDSELLSTLFYMGYLTFAPDVDRPDRTLVAPNRAVVEQFFRYYFSYLRGFQMFSYRHEAFEEPVKALESGDIRPFLTQVVQFLKDSGGINRSLHLRESDFQTALIMAARLETRYHVWSELEVRGGDTKGYADLVLESDRPEQGVSYALELKHLSKKSTSEEALTQALQAAKAQVSAYARSENLSRIPNLKLVAIVFVSDELAAMETFLPS